MVEVAGIYDPRKIGKLLACLGDHRVYRYGADSVIKFSQFDRFRTTRDLRRFYETESSMLAESFGAHYLRPRIVTDPKRTRIALIQPFVQGKPLAKAHFADGNVRTQFVSIVHALKNHQRPGEYIDLVGGGKNFFFASFGNIFVTSEGELVIIDASILRPDDFIYVVRPFVRFVVFLGNRIQATRIKNLGIDQ